MSAADTGGPAFPQINQWDNDRMRMGDSGATLRDYFAIRALPLVCSAPANLTTAWYEVVCASAYKMADEMIKARAK